MKETVISTMVSKIAEAVWKCNLLEVAFIFQP